jgi:hypothetical protein
MLQIQYHFKSRIILMAFVLIPGAIACNMPLDTSTPATASPASTAIPEIAALTPTPTFPIGASFTPEPPPIFLTIHNRTRVDICFVSVVASGEEWGENLLNIPIEAQTGGSIIVENSGIYDAKAEDCDHNEVETKTEILIQDGAMWEIIDPTIPAAVTLTIVNDTAQTICAVWTGAPGSEWAGDLLNGRRPVMTDNPPTDLPIVNTIAVGESYDLDVGSGRALFKAENCDGEQLDKQEFLLFEDIIWHVGQ